MNTVCSNYLESQYLVWPQSFFTVWTFSGKLSSIFSKWSSGIVLLVSWTFRALLWMLTSFFKFFCQDDASNVEFRALGRPIHHRLPLWVSSIQVCFHCTDNVFGTVALKKMKALHSGSKSKSTFLHSILSILSRSPNTIGFKWITSQDLFAFYRLM